VPAWRCLCQQGEFFSREKGGLGFREAGASARNVGFGHSALLEAAMATG